MTRSLMFDYAPAYELIISMAAFLERPRWKSIDLGQVWGAETEKRLEPDWSASFKTLDPIRDPQIPLLLVSQAPGDRTAEGFLNWFATLTPGELYERLICHVDETDRAGFPGDLGAWRDLMLRALRLWQERYFRHLDPAIGEHLRAEAESRRSQGAAIPFAQLVDEATNGLYLDEAGSERIVLVPQYHMRPWNVVSNWKDLRLILYPVEPIQTNPDDPPITLTRMTRSLSDENRLRILRFLAQSPANLNDLTERTGLAKSTVHHHMVMLRAAGLVILREGAHTGYYTLRPGWLDLVANRLSGFVAP